MDTQCIQLERAPDADDARGQVYNCNGCILILCNALFNQCIYYSLLSDDEQLSSLMPISVFSAAKLDFNRFEVDLKNFLFLFLLSLEIQLLGNLVPIEAQGQA